jgi:adenylosuccinate synthase
MPIIAILGAQWGDEGKGKVSLNLCARSGACARFNGGPNAGHTVVIDNQRITFRVLPAGVLVTDDVIIGAGVAIDVDLMLSEWEFALKKRSGPPRLALSSSAHLILGRHVAEDSGRVSQKIGTTGTGTGPTYRDRASRTGIRVGAVMAGEWKVIPEADQSRFRRFADTFRASVCDVSRAMRRLLENQVTVIAEGAQGALLDIDHGDYPYVTSSNTTIGGVITSLGVGPRDIDEIYVVASAYMTKVGGGPFPTRIGGRAAELLRSSGIELDGATNKIRDVGWLDLARLKWACAVNSASGIILTRLDVLQSLEEFGVYHEDGSLEMIPVQGGNCRANMRDWNALPPHVSYLIELVERSTLVPVTALSVGPGTDDLIFKNFTEHATAVSLTG